MDGFKCMRSNKKGISDIINRSPRIPDNYFSVNLKFYHIYIDVQVRLSLLYRAAK